MFTRNAVVTMVLRDVSQNLTKRKSAPWRVVEAETVTFLIPVTECLMEAMKEKGLNLAHRSGGFQSLTVTASSLVWDLEAVISHILTDQEAGDRVGSRAEP